MEDEVNYGSVVFGGDAFRLRAPSKTHIGFASRVQTEETELGSDLFCLRSIVGHGIVLFCAFPARVGGTW